MKSKDKLQIISNLRNQGFDMTKKMLAPAVAEVERYADLFGPRPSVGTWRPVEVGQHGNRGDQQRPGQDGEVGEVRREEVAVNQPIGELENDPTAGEIRAQDVWDAALEEVLDDVRRHQGSMVPSSCLASSYRLSK